MGLTSFSYGRVWFGFCSMGVIIIMQFVDFGVGVKIWVVGFLGH